MTKYDINTLKNDIEEVETAKEGGEGSRHANARRYGTEVKTGAQPVIGLPEAFALITEKGHVLYQARAVMPPWRERVQAWVDNENMTVVDDPIDVRTNGRDKVTGNPVYEIVDGRGRYIDAVEANRLLEAKGSTRRIRLEAQIRKYDNAEARIKIMEKNAMRKGVDPVTMAEDQEEARKEGVKEKDIARASGMNVKTVGRYKKLLDLDDRVKEVLRKGEISQGRVLGLLDLPREQQWDAVSKLLQAKQNEDQEGLEEAEETVTAAANERKERQGPPPRKAISYRKLEPTIKHFKKQLKAMKDDPEVTQAAFNTAYCLIHALDYASGGSEKNFLTALEAAGLSLPTKEEK